MLPDPVRAKLVALGADVLGTLRSTEAPAALRPVAKFAAAKRARLGGTAIASALESDAAFRQRVFESVARLYPGLVQSLEAGEFPAAADPVDVATVVYLQRPGGWEKLLDAAVAMVDQQAQNERQARDAEAATRIREQLEAVRAESRETRDRLKSDIARLKEENVALRRRLQQARAQASEANDAAQRARDHADEAAEREQAARRAAEAEARRLRAKLTEAEEALAQARRAGRGERDLATARLGLLLDTLAEGVAGLRRELALPASSLRPADTVEAGVPESAQPADAAGTGRADDDPALLAELLALPRVHLVVDGYNVTKAAWPTSPLEAQRGRLVQALGPVAARTGAEVTCVFDGAAVAAPVSAPPGVRVRFSKPGQTADDLIRGLVAAEPHGRAVVVVSSDRGITERIRRPGVRSVEAIALTRLLRA